MNRVAISLIVPAVFAGMALAGELTTNTDKEAIIAESRDALLAGENLPAGMKARIMALSPADRLEVLIFLRRSGMLTGPAWSVDMILSPARGDRNE